MRLHGFVKRGCYRVFFSDIYFFAWSDWSKMSLWNVCDCQVLNFNCRIRCFFFTALVSLAVNSMQFHTRVSFETYAFLFLRKFNITHDVDSEFAMAGSDIWCQPFSTGYFNLYRWQDRQNNWMAGQKTFSPCSRSAVSSRTNILDPLV